MHSLPLSRRDALKRVIGLSVALSAMELHAIEGGPPRIGGDPDLFKKTIPWQRRLRDSEKRIVTALGDLIIPADEHGPAASAVGVPDFIDEWVSAPYEQQQTDFKVIRAGLASIDDEANKRFGKGFADATPEQQTSLVDDIVKEGTEAHEAHSYFFQLFRNRVAGGYYSTPEGWKAIGYTGNVPIVGDYPGPPPEVLKHLGLA